MPFLSGEIAVLILAAGQGSRLGGGKLLLPWRGQPVLCHVVDAAAAMERAAPLFVVVGHDAAAIRATLANHPAPPTTIVDNPNWDQGQSASLQLGIETVAEKTSAANLIGVMVLLGDQPQIRTSTLDQLARAHAERQSYDSPPMATVPFYHGRRGNPVVLSPALFPRIMELTGDTGARAILSTLGERLLKVEVDDPGVVTDMDSPADYAKLTNGGKDS